VGGIVDGVDSEGDEQALDLVAGERNESIGCGVGVPVCAYDGEEGVGEHGEGDPAGPGGIAADLVLVECGQALARLGRTPPPATLIQRL
jgi:hypothetical protein